MANEEHLEIIKQGVEVWNEWIEKHPKVKPDLSGVKLINVNLNGADLSEIDLSSANLTGAKLINADLSGVKLINAILNGADLSSANLTGAKLINADLNRVRLTAADLYFADLTGAKLINADLINATLCGVEVSRADFTNAAVGRTIFADMNLRDTKGLESIGHVGPSTIGIDTLILSNADIPTPFLEGVGVPNSMIEYARSLIGQAIEYYTCFISYSSQDQDFAKRLYADLQNEGVRCWYAPEDMKTGDIIRDRIDQSIRLYDKLLLVLSEHSVQSKWVRFEVEAALDKEYEGKPPVLFPVRLDDAVLNSSTSWAAHIQRTRHITNFSKWKQHDDYQEAFTRLLRDLKQEKV